MKNLTTFGNQLRSQDFPTKTIKPVKRITKVSLFVKNLQE